MAEHRIHEAYTTSRLVWILMRFVDDERPDRRWNAVRMVKVLHLLKPGTKALVMCFLWGLLDPKGSEKYGVTLSYELVDIIGEEITKSLADQMSPVEQRQIDDSDFQISLWQFDNRGLWRDSWHGRLGSSPKQAAGFSLTVKDRGVW